MLQLPFWTLEHIYTRRYTRYMSPRLLGQGAGFFRAEHAYQAYLVLHIPIDVRQLYFCSNGLRLSLMVHRWHASCIQLNRCPFWSIVSYFDAGYLVRPLGNLLTLLVIQLLYCCSLMNIKPNLSLVRAWEYASWYTGVLSYKWIHTYVYKQLVLWLITWLQWLIFWNNI